ncbi:MULTISPECIES: ATP-binding protein [Nocardioides]|uniref:histidine kinase n=1 Tax=Nocardioides vastitatis TaxID=2568655 RepID=A0ABW0ZNW5_9ACTN|nr:sensor histidine kinase [Nocardioides sp.]THJ09225.1 sensor histidine kinase [Nocardioides sp.]
MRRTARDSPVARQILLLQLLLVLLLVGSALGLAAYDARRDSRDAARDQAVAVARSVADSPTVAAALRRTDPTATLQPFAERVRTDTGVDFVVVMSLDRIRYTHPDPDRIGEKFIGDVGGAPEGRVFTQQYTGTLGPSLRAVVPVLDAGEVVALVAVGITLERIGDHMRGSLLPITLSALGILGVGVVGAWLVSRRLRRQTHGLGEREITRMYEYYEAVLHAVREGLLLLDRDDRVQLANDEARRLLGLPDDVVGKSVHELGLPPALTHAAADEVAGADDLYVAGDHVLVVSSSPAMWQGETVGAVVTLRDRTELQSVTGELDLVRGLTDSLRAQNHEAANRLHAVVSLIEMGRAEEAVDFATEELQVAQLLTDRLTTSVQEPVLAALLLGKTAEAAERGISLEIEGVLHSDGLPLEPRELLTVVGNLVDNALDAVSERAERRIRVRVAGSSGYLAISVGDSGPGIPPEEVDRVLERGWSTKADSGRGLGLALVAQIARRHGGSLVVAPSDLGGAELSVEIGGRS